MFALVVVGLVIQQCRQPLHIAVVCVVPLRRYHQVDSWDISSLFADPVDNHLISVPSEHIDCKVRILSFKLVNM